jgi:hypothetical protein
MNSHGKFVIFAALGASVALALLSGPARANPRPLPFTYPHEQLAEGATELEQFGDFTPVRASSTATGAPVWYGLVQFQTEFEHGITDRLELGLYFTYLPAPPASDFTDAPTGTQGNGLKQRLRYKLADTGAWPIDVSLYGELAENEHELEVEGKVILQRRVGAMRLMANLTAEQAFDFDGERDVVLAPSAGATFEVTPSVQPGIEWWMRAEYAETHVPPSREFELGPHHYLGPALLLQFGPLWWTNGVYLRVSDFGHTLRPGESFGHVWVRSVLGIGI